MTLSITINGTRQSAKCQNVVMLRVVYAHCYYAECYQAESHGAVLNLV